MSALVASLLGVASLAWAGLSILTDEPLRHGSGPLAARRTRGALLLFAAATFGVGLAIELTGTEDWSPIGMSVALVLGGVAALAERHYFKTRSTYFAVALFAVVLAWYWFPWPPGHAWSVEWLATIALAQMYLTSAIRKILSPDFRTGRTLRNFLVYGALQSRARNSDFIRLLPLSAIRSRRLIDLAQLASWSTIVVELALGTLVTLHALPAMTLALMVALHLVFALLLPRRVPPFSLAVVGLGVLALATTA